MEHLKLQEMSVHRAGFLSGCAVMEVHSGRDQPEIALPLSCDFQFDFAPVRFSPEMILFGHCR